MLVGNAHAGWFDYIGEQLVAQVEVETESPTRSITPIMVTGCTSGIRLPLTEEQKRGYFKMIPNTTQLTSITDPTFAGY